MKKITGEYHEPHNYPAGWGIVTQSKVAKTILPYIVAFLITTVWVYSFMAAVHWGQHHCIKKGKHHENRKHRN